LNDEIKKIKLAETKYIKKINIDLG
jgi:hypothetical protein